MAIFQNHTDLIAGGSYIYYDSTVFDKCMDTNIKFCVRFKFKYIKKNKKNSVFAFLPCKSLIYEHPYHMVFYELQVRSTYFVRRILYNYKPKVHFVCYELRNLKYKNPFSSFFTKSNGLTNISHHYACYKHTQALCYKRYISILNV